MPASNRSRWMFMPLFFVSLIGGDYKLLSRSGDAVMRKHWQASAVLILILIVSTVSIFYASELLFHVWQAEIFLSVFISVLFAFIYIFLLTTFSKSVNAVGTFTLSNFVRTGFVVFMAFLISKPIEVMIFAPKIQPKVEQYRAQLISDYRRRLDSLTGPDLQKLESEKIRIEQRLEIYPNEDDRLRLAALSKETEVHLENRQMNLELASRRIERSDFLLFQIQVLARHPLSWAICLALIVLFILPGYLIFSISSNEAYYTLKKQAEHDMIVDEHHSFVLQYKKIFFDRWGIVIERYTKFLDPPFNTTRIPETESLTTDDFTAKYLQ